MKTHSFFALHGDFLHMISFIGMLQASFVQEFKVCVFKNVCLLNFLIRYHLRRILLGFKVGPATKLSD